MIYIYNEELIRFPFVKIIVYFTLGELKWEIMVRTKLSSVTFVVVFTISFVKISV